MDFLTQQLKNVFHQKLGVSSLNQIYEQGMFLGNCYTPVLHPCHQTASKSWWCFRCLSLPYGKVPFFPKFPEKVPELTHDTLTQTVPAYLAPVYIYLLGKPKCIPVRHYRDQTSSLGQEAQEKKCKLFLQISRQYCLIQSVVIFYLPSSFLDAAFKISGGLT